MKPPEFPVTVNTFEELQQLGEWAREEAFNAQRFDRFDNAASALSGLYQSFYDHIESCSIVPHGDMGYELRVTTKSGWVHSAITRGGLSYLWHELNKEPRGGA